MYRDAYLETEVLSASPVQLVELMYRGAMDALSQAIAAIENGDIQGRTRYLNQAQAILAELALTLDHTRGGDLSRTLTELYDYMQRRISEANFSQLAAPVHEVRGLLASLAEAWAAVGNLATQNDSGAGASRALYGLGIGTMQSSGFDGSGGSASLHESAGQSTGIDLEYAPVDSLG